MRNGSSHAAIGERELKVTRPEGGLLLLRRFAPALRLCGQRASSAQTRSSMTSPAVVVVASVVVVVGAAVVVVAPAVVVVSAPPPQAASTKTSTARSDSERRFTFDSS